MRLSLNLVEKIKELFKKKGVLLTAVLIAVGVLLISLPMGGAEQSANVTEKITLEEYKANLEGELSSMCERAEGVGRCRVMITLSRGEENTYKGSLLVESKPPRVLGVSVICEGGGSPTVKASLTEMICALFDIGTNRVAVLKLEN